MRYKFGAPDEYGDFPYISLNSDTEQEKFRSLLEERLPSEYAMQIVCQVEEQVLVDLFSEGIDSHLEAMTLSQTDRVEDRKIWDKVVQRHHAFEFTKEGMICLIRRLKEYNPKKYDHSRFAEVYTYSDYDWDSDQSGEKYTEGEVCDFREAAYNLRSSILHTLGIEDYAI